MDPVSFAEAAAEVARLLAEVRGERDRAPVLARPDEDRLASLMREPLPRTGTPLADLLREVREKVLPSCRRNDSPRFFGYVCSGGSDAGVLADFLVSGLNQNVTAWRSAPSAAEMERLVVDWIREIVGMPEGTGGLLLGGGSTANLTALAAARDARAGADVPRGGLLTLGREMTLYASDEAHMSIPRAASLLGLGRESARVVPTGPDFRMDTTALTEMVAQDREEGRIPFCVVANAGSTGTGAVDPLPELADFCRREGLWLHVDAAYGGFAALDPGTRPILEGMGAADSLTVDPHKWLHVPFDCGAVLVRDPAALRASFGEVGEYARSLETGNRSSFTFFEHGPELSRRFRALKVWMVMRCLGTEAIGGLVAHDVGLARALARRVEEAEDLELLAPVPLSTVCFRYAPRGASEGALDQANRAVLTALQREAAVYPTHAEVKGRFAIRACVLNPRTEERDLDLLLAEVRRHGRARIP
jgi:glutamate/tyrosine decarboxylase-like PLP-dependent enzyme